LTDVPIGPDVGEKLSIVKGSFENSLVEYTVAPPLILTPTGPVPPPATVATICVVVALLIVADPPPMETALLLKVLEKPVPLIVTAVPAAPTTGEKFVIVGNGTVKLLVETARGLLLLPDPTWAY